MRKKITVMTKMERIAAAIRGMLSIRFRILCGPTCRLLIWIR